jgi:hypothetical protein
LTLDFGTPRAVHFDPCTLFSHNRQDLTEKWENNWVNNNDQYDVTGSLLGKSFE